MFSIHQVKPAAVNEGLRQRSTTKNETEKERGTARGPIFIYAAEGSV